MAADPAQVIRILHFRGIQVKVDGGRLIAGPPEVMTDELRRFIRHNRDLLIAHLKSRRKDVAA